MKNLSKSGFSLVEVLIATSILLVIMVLVSIVFQQQSGAFQSGRDRVSGQASLRNVIGVISRDLSLAVDSKQYTGKGVMGIEENSFSGNSMRFLAMTGDPARKSNGSDKENGTSLQRIEYRYSAGFLNRTATDLNLTENGFSKGESTSSKINSQRLDEMDFTVIRKTGSSSTFPNAVKVSAAMKGSNNSSAVIGQSYGPDRRGDTDDDIYVGGRPD